MRNRWTVWITWTLLGVAAIAALAPLYWMISGSFKLQEDALQMPPEWVPKHPTLQNYRKLFASGDLWSGRRPALRWLVNSLVVASCISLSAVATSALAGYALAKKTVSWQVVCLLGGCCDHDVAQASCLDAVISADCSLGLG